MDVRANLIDGEWVEGEAAPNLNPANIAEVVGHYARATAADAERAIAAAKAAFPAWSILLLSPGQNARTNGNSMAYGPAKVGSQVVLVSQRARRNSVRQVTRASPSARPRATAVRRLASVARR